MIRRLGQSLRAQFLPVVDIGQFFGRESKGLHSYQTALASALPAMKTMISEPGVQSAARMSWIWAVK